MKRLVEKPRFELAAKGVFRLGRCYIFQRDISDLWASNQESVQWVIYNIVTSASWFL